MIFLITGPGHCVLNVALLGLSAVEARELHSFLKLRVIVRYYGKGAKIILEAVLFASLSLPFMVLKNQLATTLGEERKFSFFFFSVLAMCVHVRVCLCVCVYVQIYV